MILQEFYSMCYTANKRGSGNLNLESEAKDGRNTREYKQSKIFKNSLMLVCMGARQVWTIYAVSQTCWI